MARRRRQRKPTQRQRNVQALRQQQSRLRRALRELGREGYVFSDDFNLPNLTGTPTRITKRIIASLSGISRNDLRSLAQYWVDPTTGEVFSGEQGADIQRERLRQARAEALNRRRGEGGRARSAPAVGEPDETDSAFSEWQRREDARRQREENAPHVDEPASSDLIGEYLLMRLEELIATAYRGPHHGEIKSLYDRLMSAYRREAVMSALLAASDAGHVIDREIFYNDSESRGFINFINNYFDRGLGDYVESVLDMAEYVEDYDG